MTVVRLCCKAVEGTSNKADEIIHPNNILRFNIFSFQLAQMLDST